MTIKSFAQLTSAITARKAERAAVMVDAAIRRGLLEPGKRPWAIQFALQNPQGWETFTAERRDRASEAVPKLR
jgi:hypothetical protein